MMECAEKEFQFLEDEVEVGGAGGLFPGNLLGEDGGRFDESSTLDPAERPGFGVLAEEGKRLEERTVQSDNTPAACTTSTPAPVESDQHFQLGVDDSELEVEVFENIFAMERDTEVGTPVKMADDTTAEPEVGLTHHPSV